MVGTVGAQPVITTVGIYNSFYSTSPNLSNDKTLGRDGWDG